MKYNEKYNLFVDDDLVIYRWYKSLNKLVQCKQHNNGNGYCYVINNKNHVYVHRLVWETFNGDIPNGYQIDHINAVKNDNRLDNLRVVTPKENMNNPITLLKNRSRILSDFGEKFYKHYGITKHQDKKLYYCEYAYFLRNKKCRWEK